MNKFLSLIIFSLVFFNAFNLFSATINRSQEDIKKIIETIPYSEFAEQDPLSKLPLTTTITPVILATIQSLLSRNGFAKSFITNEEGYTTEIYAKIWPGEKRPTIIVTGGMGSTSDSPSMLHYAIPVAKYLGFNVIMLENSLSKKWEERNDHITASGYESGWNLYLTMKALKQHYNNSISELHAMAISLGGNDMAHALYFNSKISPQVIDGGVINWCAPGNRYEGLKSIRKKGGLGGILVTTLMAAMYSPTVFSRYTDYGFFYIFRFGDFDEVLQEVFAPISNEYFQQHPEHFKGENISKISFNGAITPEDQKTLYTLDAYIEDIKTPLLWINSENDPAVNYELTYDYINPLPKQKTLSTMLLPYGGHCGFVQSYGGVWQTELILNYVKYWGHFNSKYYDQWKRPYKTYRQYLKKLPKNHSFQ